MLYGPYKARVVEVHDGDTILLDIDLGFGHFISARDWDNRPWLSCRVFGINAPELSTEAGQAAKAYAKQLLPLYLRVEVTSHGWDKFGGRFDGTIKLPSGEDFASLMLDAGYAVPMG